MVKQLLLISTYWLLCGVLSEFNENGWYFGFEHSYMVLQLLPLSSFGVLCGVLIEELLLPLFPSQPTISFNPSNSGWPISTAKVPPPIHPKTRSPYCVKVYSSRRVRVSHDSVISASTTGFLLISSQLTPASYCCWANTGDNKLIKLIIENMINNVVIVL